MSKNASLRNRTRVRALNFLGGKCVKCNSAEKLEFDHINDDRKDDAHCIGVMIAQCVAWAKILTELDKCQLLCNPCHWDKTRKDKGYGKYKHGTTTCYRATKCRCDACSGAHKSYMKEWRAKRRSVAII